PRLIMLIYSDDPEIIAHGITYLRWMIPTYYCMGLALTCTIVLRSVGQVKIPLACSIFAFFVNVFFNWVFIFGKLGAPRMEIAGAALGTLIARVFELFFICGYFFFIDKRITYRLRDITLHCRDLVREYFRVSIPVLISDSLLALGNSAVAMIMGRIGPAFVAANSVTTVVQQLSSVLTQGISNASGIITGHTMGEGDYKKAQRQGYTFLIIGFLIGCFAALVIFVLRGPIINYYDVSPEAKAIAFDLMDAISFIVIFMAMNSILTKGVLRAGGDTKFLMIGDILFLWVASIPLGYLAGLVFHWSSFWIYTMLKLDQIIKCVWCYFRLRSGKWLKKINRAGE
ncbi:MAG: MATE family efflux transporter, partial [Clostridia bacterium]|nr:MATE family efflux transporter [Clostridia bacterium]